jgi:hypothetical protein
MAYGLRVGNFNFTYGSLSVLRKGTITPGESQILFRSWFPDVTDFRVIFTPTGTRNIGAAEKRPEHSVGSTTIILFSPSDASPHNYLVLGR